MRRAYWHLYHRYKDAPLTASALAASLVILATPACRKAADNDEAKIAAQIRTEFLHAWHNYEQYAWGHDTLRPLSKTAHDWYGQSLQMTPVDAFDTLLLMHLDSEAAKDLQLITSNLSFDRDIYVKNFEKAKRALVETYKRRSPLGLVEQGINVATGMWTAPIVILAAE